MVHLYNGNIATNTMNIRLVIYNFISLFHNKQVTYVKDSISVQVDQPVANNLSTDVNYCVMYLRMAINCSPGNVNWLLEMRSPMRT